jgi:hypothetical protein
MYLRMRRASVMVVGLGTHDVPVGHIQYIGDVYLRCIESLDSLFGWPSVLGGWRFDVAQMYVS